MNNRDFPRLVSWLGVGRWECSDGAIFNLDSKGAADYYQDQLNQGNNAMAALSDKWAECMK